ncbi:hypothetical protein EDB86DRAFT_1947855 [Lactarius hatsudake]|nr:hypothetical protein EDB86DRAFT_1947855 [Lactarius hatsudake]
MRVLLSQLPARLCSVLPCGPGPFHSLTCNPVPSLDFCTHLLQRETSFRCRCTRNPVFLHLLAHPHFLILQSHCSSVENLLASPLGQTTPLSYEECPVQNSLSLFTHDAQFGTESLSPSSSLSWACIAGWYQVTAVVAERARGRECVAIRVIVVAGGVAGLVVITFAIVVERARARGGWRNALRRGPCRRRRGCARDRRRCGVPSVAARVVVVVTGGACGRGLRRRVVPSLPLPS